MNERVLIVDDDVTNRLVLKRILKVLGYENVVEAVDGIDAMEKLVAAPPNIIFLDIMMPRLDGLVFCEIAHRLPRWKHIPVVLQSALVGVENVRKGLEAGATAYLEKPISKERVAEVLANTWSEDGLLPENIEPRTKLVLEKVISATKHTLSLSLGIHARITRLEAMEGACDTVFEHGGTIRASGDGAVELSLGCDKPLSMALCRALLLLEPEDVNDEMIADTLREVLNMLMGVAVTELVTEIPLKLGLPTSCQDSRLPENAHAMQRFSIDFLVEGRTLTGLLSIQ